MELSKMIGKMRTDSGLSQEKLGEILGVSRQAVQKWESGAALPDIDNIIKISRYFGLSTDAMIFGADKRATEELTFERTINPQYSTLHSWENYAADLATEYTQSIEEGKDIEKYSALFKAASGLEDGEIKQKLADIIFEIVLNAPTRADYRYNEPSDLETIKLVRPEDRPTLPKPDESALKDKITGAWTGRVCGCQLGKPVECMRTENLIPLLRMTGNYPMTRYILDADLTDEICEKTSFRPNRSWLADKMPYAPSDDDTNYTVLAGVLIDKYGRDFTPWDVSRVWLDYQPKNAYCTAERVAFCNFVKGYNPPESAIYKNPYREWIGAQIRADYFGYINPGDPETAADMAWRDASISHIKNGIYGEMFAAAMIAAAASTDDIKTIIAAGLGEIPANCRLAEDVKLVVKMFDDGKTSEETFAKIHEKWDEHSGHGWCHTISNAMIVAASLLYGGGDYGKSICLAVQTGFDTDCNGATVGSIIGMRNGLSGIPEEWYRPLNDKLCTSIFGVGIVKISEMGEKTLKVALNR